jgi:hypothetical protein
MQQTALSQLVVWQGVPRQIFPEGDYCFSADLGRINALVGALHADLHETHLVPLADIDLGSQRPLQLLQLRSFLEAHAARLSTALAHDVVVANTLAHGDARHATVEELSFADVRDIDVPGGAVLRVSMNSAETDD